MLKDLNGAFKDAFSHVLLPCFCTLVGRFAELSVIMVSEPANPVHSHRQFVADEVLWFIITLIGWTERIQICSAKNNKKSTSDVWHLPPRD